MFYTYQGCVGVIMDQNIKLDLLKNIEEADFVFVGIGSELQVKLSVLKEIENFQNKLDYLEKNDDYEWVIPFLIKYYLRQDYHKGIMKAYERLYDLIKDKNYFIVSLSTDDLLKKLPFREDRVVFPCGTYDKMQCENDCNNVLYDVDEKLWKQVCEWIEDKTDISILEQPKCLSCGENLVFNQYGQPVYNENGYIDNWQIYTKWLQGTVNRKLCILELGVGMEFPSIIRWPMEKVCFYNQKSHFYRVHEMLYQVAGDIEERGIAVKQNALEFLQEL